MLNYLLLEYLRRPGLSREGGMERGMVEGAGPSRKEGPDLINNLSYPTRSFEDNSQRGRHQRFGNDHVFLFIMHNVRIQHQGRPS
jgi:hypothetical protein